jgi:hypothetical protein
LFIVLPDSFRILGERGFERGRPIMSKVGGIHPYRAAQNSLGEVGCARYTGTHPAQTASTNFSVK